jgi:aspartate-semialdehyde dehydrogenase
MKLALVGATGLVGRMMIRVLEERNFPLEAFYPVASARSLGQKLELKGRQFPVISLEEAVAMAPDIALFSAGGDISLQWAPKFAEKGTFVIDNSSAWRMDPSKKLVVPEINAAEIGPEDKIIANPNCSTIQLVVALQKLHKQFEIKRLVISTYQSITGTGAKAVRQYDLEKEGQVPGMEDKAYPHPIFENCIPHCDVFLENDYTKEEMKLVNETRKILKAPQMKITATAVRVPTKGGHSESVNVEFAKDFDKEEVVNLLKATPGLVVLDDPSNNQYPMPKFANDKDQVFVGRIRKDESLPNGLNLWIVADNLRKGAATNAVQIAEYLLENKMI